MQNFDEATNDLKQAIKLSPQDKKFRQDFEALKAEKKKHNASQAGAMAKFFSEGVYNEKVVPKPKRDFKELPDFDLENVQTYFDIEIEDGEKGRVVMEIFSKQVPKTAENFRMICSGEKGAPWHYKDIIFHRIIKGFMA